MVADRQMEKQELSDGAITDMFKTVLQGSKEYYDKIVSMVAQYREGEGMVLEFKHYDIPVELLDPFWKFGEAERIVKCLKDATRQVFEEVHTKNTEFTKDIHYDEIETKLVVDDDKLVSKIPWVKTPRFANRLVVVDGLVIQKTNTLNEIVRYVYKCYSCGHRHEDKVKKCIACESRKVDILLSACQTRSYEVITLQEHQEDMKPGAIELERIDVFVYDSLVNRFKPGDHVRITGFTKLYVPRGLEDKLNKGYNTDALSMTGFVTVLEAHNIQHRKTPLEILLSNPRNILTEQDERAIMGIRKRYNDMELLNVLTNSFATGIYGHQIIKQMILIQAVGGSKVEGKRSHINILVVGDPGLAKTELLKEAKKVNIHYVMAVGKGSSGVGLTASVIKENNGAPKLSVGAAVLGNGGVVGLDEFSNIGDEYKKHLLESMESGTITINKNGINQTLSASAAYLVISNPDAGRYSVHNTLTENIKIDPPLLSRFDLIFVVLDRVNEEEDQKLNVHTGAIWNEVEPPKDFISYTGDRIDPGLLFKYIVYAKLNNQKVKISKAALQRFDNFYKDLRKPIKSSDVSATRRQYEGMLRIATGRARLLLQNEVTEETAEYVIKIMNSAYESTGMKLGNSTGLNQTSLFAKDLTKLKPERAFIEVMKLITNDNTKPVTFEDMIFALEEHLHMSKADGEELIFKMDRRDTFMRPGTNTYLLDMSHT